jgi:cystathionine gamma-synthase
MHLETLAVHAGRQIEATGDVTPAIHLSTTFERDADGQYRRGFSYSREGNPNRQMLEDCLAKLDSGRRALVFSSGLAVVTAVVQALEPGDHIVAPDDVYYCLRKVTGKIFGKWPLSVTYVDMTDLEAVRKAIRPETRLIWLETPSNPLLKVTDLAAIAEIAKATKAMTICDATFSTPACQRPLEYGIDLVTHSTTKYLNGHSDCVGGVLIAKHDSYLFERCRTSQIHGGLVPSSFDCWLTLRGVSTLPWRMRAHGDNALKVARFLEAHPAVERVYYPGLESHPGHDVAARQMNGFGGMMSFLLRDGECAARAVAARTQVFTRATSLGGPHSFIEHRASVEDQPTATPRNLLRMSIGLEHSADLIADLEQALA